MTEAPASSTFSWSRVALTSALIAVVVAAVAFNWGRSLERKERDDLERSVVASMLSQAVLQPSESVETTDADGDLVADPDENAALPEQIVFSYIAEPLKGDGPPDLSNWDELVVALSDAAGASVTATHYEKVGAQLTALSSGEVHLIGVSTGALPTAVESYGLVPLCSLAQAGDRGAYKMVVLTAADSGVQSLGDLANKDIVFVRPTSNSGFKAAFLALQDEAGLLPERDYSWGFSLSHEESIRAAVSGKAAAAPVASDILSEMIQRGEVGEDDYRVIYESEAFPPAVIGCSHRLPAATIEALRNALVSFSWEGTRLEAELGASGAQKFIPVNYKDDWANVRRIDTMVRALANRN